MKKMFLLILLVLPAGTWVAGKIMQDPGYVLLSYRNTTIEMSLWVGLILILVSMALVYGLIWVAGKLLGSGDSARRWTHGFQHRRAIKKTSAGVIDYLEGNWIEAQKKLEKAANRAEMPLVNYFAAARAAAKNGDIQSSDGYLVKAAAAVPGARLASELARAEIQIQAGQHEKALASLLQMRDAHPKHKHVCRLLQEVYVALEDWEALGQLMPQLRKLKVAPAAELDEIGHKTALSLLQRAAKEKTEGSNRDKQAARVIKVWNQIPAKIRRNEAVTLVYIKQLRALGKEDLSVQALLEAINVHWSEALVEQFGLIQGQDVQHQLLTAERWMQERNNSAVLMLALGRLSLRNKLWGKAREYFTSSIKLKKTAEACAELGRLLSYLGDEKGSTQYMQASFELMTEGLPELPMPEPDKESISKLAG